MLKLALPFQDHMILQREKRIVIWGMSEKAAAVSVAIQDRQETVRADENGCWRLEIGPLHTSFKESMTIRSGKERVKLQDIQVGDVYLAAGQSNMEFHMRYDADLSQEKEICSNENLRFFDYPKVTYSGQIYEADYEKNYAFWRKAIPDDLEWFSAVGYYFAKEIQEKYQIPVGIV